MTRRFWPLLCSVAALATLIPAASAKPNYSGAWKLNAGKSDFGPMPVPDKLERKIVHEDPSLKFSTTQTGPQGEVTVDMVYTTDGKPSTNKTSQGEVTGTAKWDGDVLTIVSKRDYQGMEITINERWLLSEDGKTLTIDRKINTPQGELESKTVLDKQ